MQIIDNLPDNLVDCRYCSQVSKANGEDPIGSAPQIDYWIIVEVPQPWLISMFEENFMDYHKHGPMFLHVCCKFSAIREQ